MQAVTYKLHRFAPDLIRQVVWLFFRFTLSLRDDELAAMATNWRWIGIWKSVTIRSAAFASACKVKTMTALTDNEANAIPRNSALVR